MANLPTYSGAYPTPTDGAVTTAPLVGLTQPKQTTTLTSGVQQTAQPLASSTPDPTLTKSGTGTPSGRTGSLHPNPLSLSSIMDLRRTASGTGRPGGGGQTPTGGGVAGGAGGAPNGNTGIVGPVLPNITGAANGSGVVASNASPPASFSPYNTISDFINNLTSSNSPYMINALRRGTELAASRGNLNSSIAAGAAQRAALEAAQPLVNNMADLQKQREQIAFNREEYSLKDALAANQAARDYTNQSKLMGQQFQGQKALAETQGSIQDRLAANDFARSEQAKQSDYALRDQFASNDAARQDWLSSQQFNREFNSALATIPITNSSNMLNTLMQYALDDPATYTPEVISGFSNFFTQNMQDIFSTYFPVNGG